MITGELRVALAGIVCLCTLIAFEAMAVSTAMPVAATDLGGLAHYGLAFSLFLTTSLLGMVLAGTWNDVRGPFAPVVAGLVAFTAGLVLCALTPTFDLLLVGRAVAGLGGGLLTVTLYVVVGLVFEPAARPRVFAWMSSAWVVPSLVGPALAGWLASDVTWRAVFALVPPLALGVAAVLLPRLRALRIHERVGDAAGAGDGWRHLLAGLTLAAGAALAQVGAGDLTPLRAGPVAATGVGLLAVGAALPRLLPVGTLRLARGLPAVVAARGLFTAAFLGAEAYVPFMLVVQRGLSPTAAGLTLTGGALGWSAGSVVLGARGRWRLRLPRHATMALGGGVVAVCVAALALPSLALVSGYSVIAVWALGGFGMGLGLSTTSVLALALAPDAERGRASAALQLSDALGSVVAIGAAGAVLSALPAADRGVTLAAVFATLGGVGLLAALAGSRGRPGAAERARAGASPASVVGS